MTISASMTRSAVSQSMKIHEALVTLVKHGSAGLFADAVSNLEII